MKFISKDWYRTRTYLHFDLPIKRQKAKKVVTNPNMVAAHAFFPLIHYTINSQKIGKDPITKKLVKLNVKQRPISYPAHLDSHIYAYYSKLLSYQYEEKLKANDLENSVIAFRSLKKSNIDFSFDAFNEIKKFGPCCVIALDVKKFFDTLDHQVLKSEWCELLQTDRLPKDHFNVYKAITKYSFIEKTALYKLLGISLNYYNSNRRRICTPQEFRDQVRKSKLICKHSTHIGIPQGTPLSAMLSNLYMFKFDLKMNEFVKDFDGKYFRYCDDMLFIVPIHKKQETETLAKNEIRNLELTINGNKTEIRTFTYNGSKLIADKHLQYLGFMFDGENIFVRSSSLARYSDRMRRGVKLAKKTMLKYNNIRLQKKQDERKLFKRKLYSRYTHLGQRNFITYGIRAAKIMESDSIKKQLKPLFSRFNNELKKDL